MANFFDQFDAPPPSGVGQNRPVPTMGRDQPDNYFSQFDAPLSGIDPVDIGKSAVSGGVEGLAGIVAMPGDLNELARHIGHAAAEFLARKKLAMPPNLIEQGTKALTGTADPMTSRSLMDKTGITPMLHKPTTRLGEGAETIGSMVPGAVAFGGTRSFADAAENAVRYGVIPGAASEAAGQATQGTPIEPIARVGAAIAGGAVPGRLVTPFPASAERQAAVATLRGEGVNDLTAGQVTGNKALKYLESETGGGALADIQAHQGEQFTGAALARTGEPAVRATPEVVNHAFERIGGEFDRLSAHNTMGVDATLAHDLFTAAHDYNGLVGPHTRAPIVHNILSDISDKMAAGPTISGEDYQALRSQIDRYARATNDPTLGHTLYEIRNALDGAMERSMSPQDQAAWRTARTQYRNLMVIQGAATGAGEDAAMGIISPAKLRQAAVGQDQRGYVRGRNDFADLAHAGQAVMSPVPQSGTAARVASRVVPAALGGILAHMATGGASGADIGGLIAGTMAPAAVGRAVLSVPGRAYLGNQLVPRGLASGRDRLIQILLDATQPGRKVDEMAAARALEAAQANMATQGPQ